jgi:hypothetical protein
VVVEDRHARPSHANYPGAHQASASGLLSRVVMVSAIAWGALSAAFLTVVLPPCVEVKSERQEVLWWSQHVRDHDRTFVGYHFLFASRKWQTGEPTKTSCGHFDVTEHRICWPVLVGEWAVILLAAVFLIVAQPRRSRVGPGPLGGTEQIAPADRQID